MKDIEAWNIILNHLTDTTSTKEKAAFDKWFNENEIHKTFYYRVKNVWDNAETIDEKTFMHEAPKSFRDRFSTQKIKDFIYKQAIGNLIGFIVGMWVVRMFSHKILERRGMNNLFGLAHRSKVVVNDAPKWVQNVIAVIIGFIVLEFINHFFQTRQYIALWEFVKKKYHKIRQA